MKLVKMTVVALSLLAGSQSAFAAQDSADERPAAAILCAERPVKEEISSSGGVDSVRKDSSIKSAQ